MGGVSTDFDNFLNVLMSLSTVLPSARMVRLICVLISSYKRSTNDYLSNKCLVRVCDDYYLTISMLLLAVLNSPDGMHDETVMS